MYQKLLSIRSRLDTEDWSTLSNAFFVFPLFVAAAQGNITLVTAISFTAAVSMLYHIKKPQGVDWYWNKKHAGAQRLLLYVDSIIPYALAWLAIRETNIFFELLKAPLPPTHLIGLACIVVGVYFLMIKINRFYAFHHGIWHLCAALGLGLILL